MSDPQIKTFVLGDYQTNCFVVTPATPVPGGPCWIVDCGFEPQALIEHIEVSELRPQALLLTHCHPDHIAGIDEMLGRLGKMPIYVHRTEADWNSDPMKNLSALMGAPVSVTAPDRLLDGTETLELDGTTWSVIHTPGHSPGGVCYVHEASKQAIVGDTLFAGSIGRIDFPGSDEASMRHTIHDVLMKWPDDMTIHPGHGPSTTIGQERSSNPFVLHGF